VGTIPEVEVDLNLPPEERWSVLAKFREPARQLLACYLRDLDGLGDARALVTEYCRAVLEPEYMAELRGVARVLDVPEADITLANLYYDAMKALQSQNRPGCTAFVVPHAAFGPLHARNLDWWTADGLLASETVVFNFRRGGLSPLYRIVGWPGFIGCLSGVAVGRFAVTLNAVLSQDPAELLSPITFVLRRALEHCPNYEAALSYLRDTPVASDSLLLLSGVRESEAAVIERSPRRAAVRHAWHGELVVTNDYRALESDASSGTDRLGQTSCDRFDRALKLLQLRRPGTPNECFGILQDTEVRLDITAQHMVLQATTGAVRVLRGA